MNKRDKIILAKIVEEVSVITRMLGEFDKTAFLADDVIMRATCMTLINIGELVKNLDNELRMAHTAIPWKGIAGLRDVAAHGYFTLSMDEIWVYASRDLPIYAEQIKEMLNN